MVVKGRRKLELQGSSERENNTHVCGLGVGNLHRKTERNGDAKNEADQ